MSKCISCDKELSPEALFCTHCGAKQDVTEEPNVEVTSTTEATEPVPASEGTTKTGIDGNEVKEKVTQTLSSAKEKLEKSGYFNYTKETAISPSGAIVEKGSIYGWIHVVVLSVLTTLSIYLVVRGFINMAFNQIGVGSLFGVNDTVISEVRAIIVPRTLIASLIFYSVFAGTAYLSLKITAKNTDPFNDFLTHFTSLLTPNLVLLAVASLVALLFSTQGMLTFAMVLIGFAMLLCFAAYNYFLYSRAEVKNLDKFYVLLISNALVLLVLALIVYSQVEPIITRLDQIGF